MEWEELKARVKPLTLPGVDRDNALAMLNQARQRGGIDEIQVEHLLDIGYRAGSATANQRVDGRLANALVLASVDIEERRASRGVEPPRLLTSKRVARWLRALAQTYHPTP